MRPKSKELKEMQGTYEPSREGVETVKYSKYEINPVAPDGWPPHIQKIWRERCQDLKEAGYLAKAFMPLLKRYCYYILMAEEAESNLQEHGFIEHKMNVEGVPYEAVSKWVSLLEIATKGMERTGAKLGFSPLDIQKIPVISSQSEAKTMSLLK